MDVAKKSITSQPNKPTRISLNDIRQQAIACHQSGNLKKAISAYKTCLKINPADIGLWSNLGAALRKQKHYASAVNCYRRALELKPNDSAAQGNLANVLKDLHRYPEAMALHAQLVDKNSDTIQSLMNYACVLREAGLFEQALQQLNKAKVIEPNNAGVEWERAQNLLYLGRYTDGWLAYEARWLTGDLPQRDFPYPQWKGELLKGKRLLLHTEQGYGDTILAARYIPLLKQHGAIVTLHCKPELHRLFQYLGADELMAVDAKQGHVIGSPQGRDFDYHCPLMSVMAAMKTLPDTIPAPTHINIPVEAQQKFSFLEKQHVGCLKIGIVWSGSITFANNDNRAVELAQFLPLAEIPKVRLYSLQKGPCEKALYETGADCVIENLGRLCEDFADTAAAIAQLDIIVMTDSSVAHLAASMGKPVINLLQKTPYWLYTLAEETTPWYPSMQLIKQTTAGQWDDVFERVGVLIAQMAADKE